MPSIDYIGVIDMHIAHLAIGQTVRLRPAITIPTGKGRCTDFISPRFVEAVVAGFTPGPNPHAVLVNLPIPGPWNSPQWVYPDDLHCNGCDCLECELDAPRDPFAVIVAAEQRERPHRKS
ncbi:hypothetical protein [Glycomyces buryatensis]|uniref:Uncharacterized protein n=1 Tax=Glycomyces buryatensis TaxID=2570927 RepID=A0A4S8PYG7_9ACTN|nr:hypothetical protein [Glycomyces buryatensis]THV35711.1 hypothetical protein FAB82_22830 [Glycomyces buryatensis]